MRRNLPTLALPTLVLLASLAGLTACSDDDNPAAAAAPSAASTPTVMDEATLLANYCADMAGVVKYSYAVTEGLSEDGERNGGADEAPLLAAERKVLEYARPHFAKPAELRPSEIRADALAWEASYATRVESDFKNQGTAEQDAAEERLFTWLEKNCPRG